MCGCGGGVTPPSKELGEKKDWVFDTARARAVPVASCFGGFTLYDLPVLLRSGCR